MNFANEIRARQGQQIVVAAQITLPRGEAFATVLTLGQSVALNHRAHGTIEHENALGQRVFKCGSAGGSV